MVVKSSALLVKRLIIAVCVLSVVCIALAIALCVVVATTGSKASVEETQDCPTTSIVQSQRSGSSAFDDLSVDEILAVRDYVLKEPSLNVTPLENASISSNYIYLIELQVPPKDAVLDYLDDGGQRPTRQAKVILHKGGQKIPVVEEYIVEPADKPEKHSQLGHSIPFHKRVFDKVQLDIIENFVLNLTRHSYRLLKESYDGFTYHNCTDRCLTWSNSQPGALESGGHKSWVWFTREVQGMYIQPVGFEVLFDCPGTDPSLWKIEMIYYNNMTFGSIDQLMDAYDGGTVKKIFYPMPSKDEVLYSSYRRRGDPQPAKPTRGPRQFEPDGKRYYVQDRHVEWMGWSFDFRARSTTGIQIFDLKFQGTRIVYELSLQEASAFYSGYSPLQMFTEYLDTSWGMGHTVFELVRGVDCPESATFIDLVHHVDSPRPRRMKNAVCVFEYNTGIPLRRHFENDFEGGYKFYGGMPTYALVLRYISTPYNYDYVYDYLFYANGVVEVRVSTSGYIQATYWTSQEQPYANEVHKNVAGSIHDHMLNYKVDLDVAGRKNSYQTIDIEKEVIANPWFPGRNRTQKVSKGEGAVIPATDKTEQLVMRRCCVVSRRGGCFSYITSQRSGAFYCIYYIAAIKLYCARVEIYMIYPSCIICTSRYVRIHTCIDTHTFR